MKNITFDKWLNWAFQHPVLEREWYWEENVERIELSPSQTITYITRVFENPIDVLSTFTDAQIDQGLWFIAHDACSNHMFAVIDETVPFPDRKKCVWSFYSLYKNLFAVRCSPHLSHLNEEASNPLNSICYMWWDLLPIEGEREQPSRAELDNEILSVMDKTLSLESNACREGALHGLGHWQKFYPEIVAEIIDNFLSDKLELRPELREYASKTKKGQVL